MQSAPATHKLTTQSLPVADSYLEGIRAFNVAFTATIIHLISHTHVLRSCNS
jgi:hypothetical protein